MARSNARKRKRASQSEDDTLRCVSTKRNAEESTANTIQRDIPSVEQDSPLLRLPHELLVHTLSYLLTNQDDNVKLHSAAARRWRNEAVRLDFKGTCSCPPPACHMPDHHLVPEPHNGRMVKQSRKLDLFLTCRALYFAGTEAFYTSNTFEFPSATALASFINTTNTDRRNSIRRVKIGMIWMSSGTWEGRRRCLPPGCKVTCAFDEPTLESDMFEDLPNLLGVQIHVGAQPAAIWTTGRDFSHLEQLDANEQIQERIETAWPSIRSKMTIEYL